MSTLTTKDLYQRVIRVVNYFLEDATGATLSELREFDPSIEQLAKDLRIFAALLKDIAGSGYEDQDMAINAMQCCWLMDQIAGVVLENHSKQEELEPLMRQLETHARVP